MKRSILISVILFFTFVTFGHSQVTVVLQQPPPFRFDVDNLWKVTLTNLGSAVNVYLYGEVVTASGIKVVEGRTANFIMPSGTKKVAANEISPVDITKYDNTIDNTLKKTGTFKSGEYNICVYVRDALTNADLGVYCNLYEIINSTQSELIMPEDGESIMISRPVFSWLPPSPNPQGVIVTYQINIFPVMNRQTPYYASISSPAYYTEKNIKENVFQYPVAGKSLIPGMKYAWQISTFYNGVLYNSSEVRSFVFVNNNFAETISETESKNKSYRETYDNKFISATEYLNYKIKNLNSEEKINSENKKYPKLNLLNSAGKNDLSIINEKPFNFSASYKIFSNLQNYQSHGTQPPKNYISATFNPTITIYGIPFTADLYIDSKQRDFKQNLNSFAFLFDLNSLTKKIKTKLDEKKNQLIEEYKNKGEQELKKAITNVENSLPGYMKVLSMFKNIGIWETYPVYTDYTVSGVKVKGLDFTFNPGLIYLQATGLSNLDKITDSVFSRNLYATSLGVGEKENSHWHFNFMKSFDNENSIDVSKLNSQITPGENTVLGFDNQLNFFGERFSVKSEANVSVTTRDKLAPKLNEGELPKIIEDLTNANTSSQFDFMYKTISKINIPESKSNIEAEYKLIGPGYITYGNPGLSGKGKYNIKVKLDQELLEGKIKFTGSYEYRDNNVGGLNSVTTTSQKMDFKVSLKFEDAPTLMLRYIPVTDENDASLPGDYYKNNLDVFMMMSSLKYKTDGFLGFTTLLVTSTSGKDNKILDSNNYSLMDLSVNQSINFKQIPFSINAGVSYNTKNSNNDKFNTTGLNISGTYTLFDIWSNTLGLNYLRETGKNKKLSLVFSTGLPILNLGDLFINAEQNFYSEDVFRYGDNDDFVLTATISKSF